MNGKRPRRIPTLAGWVYLLLMEVGPVLASVATGIFATLWSVDKHAWQLIVAIAFGVFAICIPVARNVPEINRLLRRAATSDQKAEALRRTLEDMLQKSMQDIECNGNQTRVSLYFFHDSSFHMLARYSSNPELAKSGRGVYSTRNGVIGQAWLEEFAIATLPSSKERWMREVVDQYGIQAGDAEKISMRARRIAGFAVRYDGRSVGVVMIESLDVNAFNEGHVRKLEELTTASILPALVGRSAKLFPAIDLYEEQRPKVELAQAPEQKWQQSRGAVI